VEFFFLQDLVRDGRIRWFDDAGVDEWVFADSPLPKSPDAYISYLDNVLRFVGSRSKIMAAALAAAGYETEKGPV
jgi:hypothetical protein